MPSKKAIMQDWLPFLLIVIILLFAGFYMSLNNFGMSSSAKEKITRDIMNRDSSDILLNYLKSPLRLEKFQDANIADGISYYSIKEDTDLLVKLQASTDEFFSKSSIETDYSSYLLQITYNGKELILQSEKSRTQLLTKKEISKISIPTPYKDDIINIRLFLITTDKCREHKEDFICN